MSAASEDDFWDAAQLVLDRPGVTRSTMMGYPCLRRDGDFFASWDPRHRQLVVKLDRTAVTDMIRSGDAEPFAPNGRPFKEWAALPARRREHWVEAIDEAFEHAERRSR